MASQNYVLSSHSQAVSSTADTASPTRSISTMSTASAAPTGSMSSASVTGTKALAKRAIRVAQAVADAKLDSAYETSNEGFDYHDSVEASKGITQGSDGAGAASQGGGKPGGAPVASYLQRMQRGGLVQSFGCLLVVEEGTFKVLAHSANAKDMLGLIPREPTDEEREAERKKAEEEAKARREAEEAAKAETSKSSPAKSTLGRAISSLKDKISSAIRRSNKAAEDSAGPRGRSAKPSSGGSGRVGSPARSLSPSKSWLRSSRRMEHQEGDKHPSNLGKEKGDDAAPALPPLPVLAFGADARSLFTPDSITALEKATSAADLSMVNPVLLEASVTGRGDHRAFYAILHRIDVGIVVDLEPIRESDPLFTGAGALQAHKLAAKAITRLQKLPPGDMRLLCETVVEEVKDLTGYDRVMTYKFHEDEHGEVVAESKRPAMEPYRGLHYPATDIPQAIRFLFMKNRVRCICDSSSEEVPVLRDETRLKQPVTLAGSQLRAPQRCHIQYMRNMGTGASMTMAVIINDEDAAQNAPAGASQAPPAANKGRRLWGLVVCHHQTARYLPFPLRLACEFLMQVLSLQVNMALEMGRQQREKDMLRTQTLLCDLLLRGDAPLGIVSQNPNIRDLVKCDGAAMYYAGRFWLLGTTPSEMQILDIIDWLDEAHADSSGLSTDSLAEAGYPRADELGESVCGMACARLYARDVLLWFRSHVRKEVRWGSEKHDERNKEDEHPERMAMGPRASFAAFLEVVRQRSMPWEDVEMDAIHSLQLILRGHLTSFSDIDMKEMMMARMKDQELDRLSATESEMVRVLETATAPILAVDREGAVTGWNARLAALTGMSTGDALGQHLITDLVEEKNVDVIGRALFLALQGQETKELELHLRTFGAVQSSKASVILVVNAFASRGSALGGDQMDEVVGVCFVGQDVTAQKAVMGKFTRLQGDYEAIVHGNNSLIPPIFSTDDFGLCTDWNPAMERITGVPRTQAMDKLLLGGVFGPICRMKADTMTKVMIVMNQAMAGQMTDRYPMAFLDAHGQLVEALLTVQTRRDSDGVVTGVFCFLHTASSELQAALTLQRATQEFAKEKAKAVAYVRSNARGPMDGIEHAVQWMRRDVEAGRMKEELKGVVMTAVRCKEQMDRVMGDDDIDTIEEGYVNIIPGVFTLDSVVDAVIAQGKAAAARRGVALSFDPPPQLKGFPGLAGDCARLQQAMGEYLATAIAFTPASGSVKVRLVTSTRSLFGDQGSLKCEFRVQHSGNGLPQELVQQLHDEADPATRTQEGLGLSVCRKILLSMAGDVQYDRNVNACEFVVRIGFPFA